MKTRCVPGDLAFIIQDEPGCEANLGRVVIIHGPSRLTTDRGLEWLIVPVNPSPLCFESDGEVVWGTVPTTTRIRHSDTWLMPIQANNLGNKTIEAMLSLRDLVNEGAAA